MFAVSTKDDLKKRRRFQFPSDSACIYSSLKHAAKESCDLQDSTTPSQMVVQSTH
jgi:hypothetical protein